MTQNRTRKAAEAPTPPPEDPLADLREDDDRAPGLAQGDDDAPEAEPELEPTGLVTVETQEAARAEMVAAWHADTVALGFLHRGIGGNCGCRYLAQQALNAVMPVTLELEPELDAEPEPEDAEV